MNNGQDFIGHPLPELPKLAPELVRITKAQRIFSLTIPFLLSTAYLFFRHAEVVAAGGTLANRSEFCYLWFNISRPRS